jgi:hypothetical protein
MVVTAFKPLKEGAGAGTVGGATRVVDDDEGMRMMMVMMIEEEDDDVVVDTAGARGGSGRPPGAPRGVSRSTGGGAIDGMSGSLYIFMARQGATVQLRWLQGASIACRARGGAWLAGGSSSRPDARLLRPHRSG